MIVQVIRKGGRRVGNFHSGEILDEGDGVDTRLEATRGERVSG